MILVVTNKQDVTSDLVILQMQQRGIPFARLNTEDYLQAFNFTWNLGGDRFGGEIRTTGGVVVALREVTAMWYRRPASPEPTEMADPAARAFALQEREGSLSNLWALLDCLWVSRPERIRYAESTWREKLERVASAPSLPIAFPAPKPMPTPHGFRVGTEILAKVQIDEVGADWQRTSFGLGASAWPRQEKTFQRRSGTEASQLDCEFDPFRGSCNGRGRATGQHTRA